MGRKATLHGSVRFFAVQLSRQTRSFGNSPGERVVAMPRWELYHIPSMVVLYFSLKN